MAPAKAGMRRHAAWIAIRQASVCYRWLQDGVGRRGIAIEFTRLSITPITSKTAPGCYQTATARQTAWPLSRGTLTL